MGNLNFSDGVKADTSGEFRPKEYNDGWYVVGKGMLIPVEDRQEAEELIKRLKGEKQK